MDDPKCIHCQHKTLRVAGGRASTGPPVVTSRSLTGEATGLSPPFLVLSSLSTKK